MADDPTRGPNQGPDPALDPGPSRGDTLYDDHEPTRKVDRASINMTLHGMSQDAALMLRPAPPSSPSAARAAVPAAAPGPMPGAAPGAMPEAADDPPQRPSQDLDGPVFVSMKPRDERDDKTEIVPAIDRPDMRPRLRPYSEPRVWPSSPGELGHYATPRPGSQRKRSWLWLYVVLTVGAALAGAGITLWLRSIW